MVVVVQVVVLELDGGGTTRRWQRNGGGYGSRDSDCVYHILSIFKSCQSVSLYLKGWMGLWFS